MIWFLCALLRDSFAVCSVYIYIPIMCCRSLLQKSPSKEMIFPYIKPVVLCCALLFLCVPFIYIYIHTRVYIHVYMHIYTCTYIHTSCVSRDASLVCSDFFLPPKVARLLTVGGTFVVISFRAREMIEKLLQVSRKETHEIDLYV